MPTNDGGLGDMALTPEQLADWQSHGGWDGPRMNGVIIQPGATQPGQPGRPGYEGYTNPDGTLKDPFKLGPHQVSGDFSIDASGYVIPKFDDVTMDPQALNQIKEQAFNQGPSAWAQMLNMQQGRNQQDAYDTVANQGAGQNAQAQASLSRLGGLSSGAMERLATSTQKNNAFGQNAVLRQGMGDRSNIGIADQANKSSMLMAIPGFQQNEANLKLQNNAAMTDINKFNTLNQIDLSKYNKSTAADLAKYNNTVAAQSDQFNVQNQIKDIEGKNAFGQGVYSDQMKAWAAQQQADATTAQANNSGGSWLCTEASKTRIFDKSDMEALALLSREFLRIDPQTAKAYFLNCSPLIEKMRARGANWGKNAQFISSIIALAHEGNFKKAFDAYADYTIACIEKYWPECKDPAFLRIRDIRKTIEFIKGA